MGLFWKSISICKNIHFMLGLCTCTKFLSLGGVEAQHKKIAWNWLIVVVLPFDLSKAK
jgi:hypothetical protein